MPNDKENRNQTPPDIDDVLAQLEELGDGDQPAEGQDTEIQFADTDEGKKQAHAFAKQSRLLRQAKSVIRSLKEKPVETQTQHNPPAPQGRPDASAQASAIMYQLQLEAIQNTGIADPSHPMVVLEINRLYAEKVAQLRNRNEAGAKAPQVFEAVAAMPQFKRLAQEDLTEILSRVKSLAPEAQADERTVKSVFALYIGENIEKFANATPPSGRKSDDDGDAAAASSPARSRGVPPPNRGPSAGNPPPKPPDEKEAREMRSIGLDPFEAADVVRYRAATKRRGQYGAA